MVSDNLVVQTIEEKPKVLIITDETQLASQVSREFEVNGFAVVVVSPSALTSQNQTAFYKILTIVGYQSPSAGEFNTLLTWLAGRSEQKLYFRLFPILVSKPIDETPWKLTNQQLQTEIFSVQSKLPNTTICLGQNVLEYETLFFLNNTNHDRTIKQLVYLNCDWFPQNLSSLLGRCSQIFISPWRGEVFLLQGKQENVQQFVHHLQKTIESEVQIQLSTHPIDVITPPQLSLSNMSVLDTKKYTTSFLDRLIKTKKFAFETKIETKKEVLNPHFVAKNQKTPPEVENSRSRLIRERQKKPILTKNDAFITNVENSEKQLEQAVDKLFSENQVVQKTDRIDKLAVKTKKIAKKNKKKSSAFWGGMIFVGLGLSIVCLTAIFLGSTLLLRNNLFSQLTKLSQSGGVSQVNSHNLQQATSFVEYQTNAYQTIFSPSWFTQQRLLVEAGNSTIGLVQGLTNLETSTSAFYESFVGTRSGDVFVLALDIRKEAELAYKNVSLLSASLDSIQPTTTGVTELNQKIDELQTRLVAAQQVSPIMSELFAQQEKKNYLLILQDNQELRPTGGFFQTMALITVDRGILIDKQVFSSYQIDSMLSGETTAPPEVEQYLGEKQLYIRDANWDPDFEKSAQTIGWLFQRATGKQVDGVIGLNLFVLQGFLEVVGPLDIPEYNEVLTSKNLMERAEFHSELQLVDASKQTDYLSLVFQKTLDSLIILPHEKVSPLLESVEKNLSAHQLLVGFSQPSLNSSFESMGWTGKILSPQCPTQFSGSTCVADSMFQVEANVGVNKANYDLKRTISETIHLTENGVQHQRKIVFKNNAKTNAWPQGAYKTYLRFYVDSQAILDDVLINGEPLEAGKITIYQSGDKAIFGVLVEVPIQQQVELVLDYHLNQNILTNSPSAYVYFDQKQAGTDQDPHTIQIFFPQDRQPTLIAPQADVSTDSVTFKDNRETHSFVGIML